MKTLLECLEPNHLLQVFFQLLLEENVLFISSSSLNLTATAEAFCSLLYPFKWMSPYIPLLPRLIGEELFADFELDCPVPFIIGKYYPHVVRSNFPDYIPGSESMSSSQQLEFVLLILSLLRNEAGFPGYVPLPGPSDPSEPGPQHGETSLTVYQPS